MSKGNSGILSKHQAKLSYSSLGIIGDSKGYEVLKEVVLRISSNGVNPSHEVRIYGRMANDSTWYDVGTLLGPGTATFHIASWDYVLFECMTLDSVNAQLITSGYFNDGMFAVDAVNAMKEELSNRLVQIDDSICKIHEEVEVLKTQISLITDHEEDEVK